MPTKLLEELDKVTFKYYQEKAQRLALQIDVLRREYDEHTAATQALMQSFTTKYELDESKKINLDIEAGQFYWEDSPVEEEKKDEEGED